MPICKRCGYEWKYEGRNIFEYCYRCNKELEKQRNIKKIKILKEIIKEVISENKK